MTQESKAHFKELGTAEKKSKLSFLASQKMSFMIWKKGEKQRINLIAQDYIFEKETLNFKDSNNSLNHNEKYLYSFYINGVNFFGILKYKYLEGHPYFDCSDKLYKSERRQNYRLLVYPQYKAFAQVYFDFKEPQESNVVDFKTKQSQTGLFKNFLKLVDDENAYSKIDFRIFDLSVNGLALLIGDIEKEILTKNPDLKLLHIKLHNNEITIPKGEITHITPLVGNLQFTYKVGIKFGGLNTNLDNQLGFIINKFLRDTDFEDFLK